MTEIEQKALAMLDEVCAERSLIGGWHKHARETHTSIEALCRAIEQHEQFKREVSDAVEAVFAGYHDAPIPWVVMRPKLEPFILPKPVDPLVEAWNDMLRDSKPGEDRIEVLRAALAKRGLEVREIEG